MKDALGHGSDAHQSGIATAIPSTAYELAKAHRDALEAEVRKHGEVLEAFPKGPMGLTPDHVRTSPAYREAKYNFDRAFATQRAFNGAYMKQFKKEIKADRAKRFGR